MKKTAFNDIHEKLGAKLVDFAGYKMPIQYSSIIAEHKAVRNSVGVFDVSHMGEIFIKGEKAFDFVQNLTVNDVSALYDGRVQYSAMCYENGGIVDDLLVYRINEKEYLLVVNASNKQKDFEWMKANNPFGVEIVDESDEYSLLAVQGPNSGKVIDKIIGEKNSLEYYHFRKVSIFNNEVILSRTGYTGELGFELYFKNGENFAEKIWNAIFEAGKEFDIQPVGLGARDSLRLEMGFCLYGNDIDQNTNPIEAGLGWITKLKKPSFIGKDILVEAKEKGTKRKLTALISEEKIFPRKDYEIKSEGKVIGKITSGTVSPSLDKAIALAYIDSDQINETNKLNISIRGKEYSAQITKLPFVKK
ncbi:MAG: glycine cleavage system aminomethyltransferase GcvT [Melioribacteraceae bacterium]|jgi:aminomethyltransferase|nr:glycine cleavage system aminomethyltransferase GcvT [Melioribacteraceae bacterium]